MDIFCTTNWAFVLIDARVEKLVRVFDSLKTRGFTPQNHHVGMLEELCDCQVWQNTEEGAKTFVKVPTMVQRLSSGQQTGHDVLRTACKKSVCVL